MYMYVYMCMHVCVYTHVCVCVCWGRGNFTCVILIYFTWGFKYKLSGEKIPKDL